ncbi:MAG TPA: endolytic transglycosylase MltG, partial [Cyclobacteriaceae bacterium]|nr:endolytic transglycosylase MltG [Cyclobacteriaceae bacterium]
MNEVPKGKLIAFLVGSMLLITFTFYGYQIFFTPNVLVDREDRLFEIHQNATFRVIQDDLGKGGFVNDMVSFSFLARVYGYDKEIRPGRYLLKRNMTNLAAINALKANRNKPAEVTFTNVRLINQLGEKITKNIGVTEEEFYRALDKFVATNTDGFTKENILSMFIPNTYEVYYNVLPEDFIDRMHSEYKKFWSEDRLAKAKAVGLTPVEVSVLASIVQAETIKSAEAPIIAGLYINRLKQGVPLQADPTLVFAVGDFTLKRVLNVHKEVDSTYNTYMYPGLPPGPINMPTIASIDAVLDYTKHNFIYMCAKEDFSGNHNFA